MNILCKFLKHNWQFVDVVPKGGLYRGSELLMPMKHYRCNRRGCDAEISGIGISKEDKEKVDRLIFEVKAMKDVSIYTRQSMPRFREPLIGSFSILEEKKVEEKKE